jgi:hypothetical protein
MSGQWRGYIPLGIGSTKMNSPLRSRLKRIERRVIPSRTLSIVDILRMRYEQEQKKRVEQQGEKDDRGNDPRKPDGHAPPPSSLSGVDGIRRK